MVPWAWAGVVAGRPVVAIPGDMLLMGWSPFSLCMWVWLPPRRPTSCPCSPSGPWARTWRAARETRNVVIIVDRNVNQPTIT